MEANPQKYSDKDLEEFKVLILNKIAQVLTEPMGT